MSYYDDVDFATGDYDRYYDRQERLEQANFRRDVLNGRYDRILGIIFGEDNDLFL